MASWVCKEEEDEEEGEWRTSVMAVRNKKWGFVCLDLQRFFISKIIWFEIRLLGKRDGNYIIMVCRNVEGRF